MKAQKPIRTMELYLKYEDLNDTNAEAKPRAYRKIVTFAGGRTLMPHASKKKGK